MQLYACARAISILGRTTTPTPTPHHPDACFLISFRASKKAVLAVAVADGGAPCLHAPATVLELDNVCPGSLATCDGAGRAIPSGFVCPAQCGPGE